MSPKDVFLITPFFPLANREKEQAVDKKKLYEQRRVEVVDAFEKTTLVRLGYFEPFKEMQTGLVGTDHKGCPSLLCMGRLHNRSWFSNDIGSKDGLNPTCKGCKNRDKLAVQEAIKNRKQVVADMVANKGTKTSAGDTETRIIQDILLPLMGKVGGLEAGLMPEFTNADAYASHPNWTDTSDNGDKQLGIQVKVDSEFGEGANGEQTRKADDRKHHDYGGGKATFSDCKGYDGKGMVFIKVRFNGKGNKHVTMWVCNYSILKLDEPNEKGKPKGGTIDESNKGLFFPKSKTPLSPLLDFEIAKSEDTSYSYPITDQHQELADTLFKHLTTLVKPPNQTNPTNQETPLLLVPYEALRWEVERESQLMELILMHAYGAVIGHDNLRFPKGNQSAVDFEVRMDGGWEAAQAKTGHFHAKRIEVNVTCRRNGVAAQAYVAGAFRLLLTGRIVKSMDVAQGRYRYFLVYALLEHTELLKEGLFQTTGVEGCIVPARTTSLSMSYGDLAEWLERADPKKGQHESTQWLRNRFEDPVELVPGECGLTEERLEMAAGEPVSSMSNAPKRVKLAERDAPEAFETESEESGPSPKRARVE